MPKEVRLDGEPLKQPHNAAEVGAVALSQSEAGLAKRKQRFETVSQRVHFTPGSFTEIGIIELEGESPDNPNYSPMALWNAVEKKSAFSTDAAHKLVGQAYGYFQEASLSLARLYSANSTQPEVVVGDAKIIRSNNSAMEEIAKLELARAHLSGKSKAYRAGSRPYKKEIEARVVEIKSRPDTKVVSAWANAHHDVLLRKRYWRRQLESIESHPEYQKGVASARIPLNDVEQAA